jgi:hypothetical protein
MSTPDRAATREVFFRAWAHYRAQQPLEGVERLIVQVALQHPEYQAVLDAPDSFNDRDYLPETGQTNPFLHLGLHIALEEQLSVDQPRGLRGYYERLCTRTGDSHAAQHQVLECLAEALWQMQRHGTTFDESRYLKCVAHALGDPVD